MTRTLLHCVQNMNQQQYFSYSAASIRFITSATDINCTPIDLSIESYWMIETLTSDSQWHVQVGAQ